MTDALTLEQKIAFAQRASDVDIDELGSFCDSEGLPMQELTAWSTAYESAGKLGVQAMIASWRPAPRQSRTWQEEIKGGLKSYRPRRFRVRAEGNHYTVEEVKPLTMKSIVYTPFFQLRVLVTDEVQHWFLYWRRADGSWWPYAGQHSFESNEAAIKEVVTDQHGCFRLHPLH